MHASLLGDLLVGLSGSEGLLDVVCASTTEDDDVKERVRTETVRAVDGHTCSLTSGVETGDDLVLAVLDVTHSQNFDVGTLQCID